MSRAASRVWEGLWAHGGKREIRLSRPCFSAGIGFASGGSPPHSYQPSSGVLAAVTLETGNSGNTGNRRAKIHINQVVNRVAAVATGQNPMATAATPLKPAESLGLRGRVASVAAVAKISNPPGDVDQQFDQDDFEERAAIAQYEARVSRPCGEAV